MRNAQNKNAITTKVPASHNRGVSRDRAAWYCKTTALAARNGIGAEETAAKSARAYVNNETPKLMTNTTKRGMELLCMIHSSGKPWTPAWTALNVSNFMWIQSPCRQTPDGSAAFC